MTTYFDKHKSSMFPDITEWKSDQPKYRYAKPSEIRKMPYKYWIFFTPSAYHLINFSFLICTVLSFGFIFIYSLFNMMEKSRYVLLLVMSLMVLVSVVPKLYQAIKNYNALKHFTFYDLWMKED